MFQIGDKVRVANRATAAIQGFTDDGQMARLQVADAEISRPVVVPLSWLTAVRPPQPGEPDVAALDAGDDD